MTIWSSADKLEQTSVFYRDTLGLSSIANNVFNARGTYLVVMQGDLGQPKNTQRRWPLFALTVSDLEQEVIKLKHHGFDFPWGIEEFNDGNTASRYVMFYDPAGNLIELVEWL